MTFIDIFKFLILLPQYWYLYQMKDTTNDHKYYYQRGLNYLKLKKFEDAIIDFKESLKRSPNDFSCRVHLSDALIEINQNEQAEKGKSVHRFPLLLVPKNQKSFDMICWVKVSR